MQLQTTKTDFSTQMHRNKYVLTVAGLIMWAAFSFGQNSTNSPYTRFGYGAISDNSSGEQRAMGGLSFGLRTPTLINTANPASYSSVDTLSFMLDMGISALASVFSDKSGQKTSITGNLEYLNMQFPLGKYLGGSLGIQPYSFSGYDFYDKNTYHIDPSIKKDTTVVTRSYSGQGGISQAHGGLSVKLFNHLALGANIYYMFGSSVNRRSINFSHDGSSAYQENRIQVNDFRLRYGLQVFHTVAKRHSFTLGGIFEAPKVLNAEATSITVGMLTDTVKSGKDEFELPMHYGAGISYTYDRRLTVGLDYSMQNWEQAKFFGKTDSLVNRSRMAIGAEYMANPNGRKFSDLIRYRFGISVSDSYYRVKGTSMPKNIGISFGVGIPLPQAKTLLNASIEYGKLGSNNLMNENYLKLTFNASINEFWFFKRKL